MLAHLQDTLKLTSTAPSPTLHQQVALFFVIGEKS